MSIVLNESDVSKSFSLAISGNQWHQSQAASHRFTEMRKFRCNGCLRHLTIGRAPSVTTTDASNPSYLTTCDHLYCDFCRNKYRSFCPICQRQVQWIDTSLVSSGGFTKDKFQPLDVLVQRLQKVQQFQMKHRSLVNRLLVDIQQEKKQRARDWNEKIWILKQRYQHLKDKYTLHRRLYKRNHQIEMWVKVRIKTVEYNYIHFEIALGKPQVKDSNNISYVKILLDRSRRSDDHTRHGQHSNIHKWKSIPLSQASIVDLLITLKM